MSNTEHETDFYFNPISQTSQYKLILKEFPSITEIELNKILNHYAKTQKTIEQIIFEYKFNNRFKQIIIKCININCDIKGTCLRYINKNIEQSMTINNLDKNCKFYINKAEYYHD